MEAQATICPGIIGYDGTVTGRVTDMELFQAINFDMTEMRDLQTGEFILTDEQRRKMKRNPRWGDLWAAIPRRALTGSKAVEQLSEREQRLAKYAGMIAGGSPLFETREEMLANPKGKNSHDEESEGGE